MKKALLLAPMGSVHRRFNKSNIIALKNLGYEVTLIGNFEQTGDAQDGNKLFIEECKKDDINVVSMPFARHSLKQSLKLLPQLKKHIKENHYDLIHAHTETGGFLLRMVSRVAKNSKLVFTPHGMSFYKGSSLKSQIIYRAIEKWIAKKMDANLAMNSEEFEVLQKWKGKTARFVHGVGLDCNMLNDCCNKNIIEKETLGIHKDVFLIISVGELNENKNHEVIIKALSKIRNKNFYYLICGVGEKRKYLDKLSQEKGIRDKIMFAGYREDVPSLLRISDLFVFPSYHEGLPVSIMEAMTIGVPVICSKIRGNVDLINDNENGLLCKPNDEEAFLNGIELLMEDAEKRKVFIEKSKTIISQYDIKTVIKELENVYLELCDV